MDRPVTFTPGLVLWYGPPEFEPSAPEPMGIEEATYEQWIGLLYACAVFRGVLTHPVPWPYDSHPIGYVVRVGD